MSYTIIYYTLDASTGDSTDRLWVLGRRLILISGQLITFSCDFFKSKNLLGPAYFWFLSFPGGFSSWADQIWRNLRPCSNRWKRKTKRKDSSVGSWTCPSSPPPTTAWWWGGWASTSASPLPSCWWVWGVAPSLPIYTGNYCPHLLLPQPDGGGPGPLPQPAHYHLAGGSGGWLPPCLYTQVSVRASVSCPDPCLFGSPGSWSGSYEIGKSERLLYWDWYLTFQKCLFHLHHCV